MIGGPLNFSEDCLYLKIWSTFKNSSEKFPVMVWIQGEH
jgi:carboxylesterase type B